MRFVTFNGEESLTALVTRVFGPQVRGAQVKQAADLLLKTNPRLKDLGKVPVGSLITVPDKAPPIVPGQEAIAAGTMRSQIAQTIQLSLDALQKRLSEIDASTVDRIKAAVDRIPAAEIKKGLKEASKLNGAFPDAQTDPAGIAKDAKDIIKNVQSAQSARKQVFIELQRSLATFMPRIAGGDAM
jgi:uncharacterized phage infection (PIP) family protein YhgE